MDELPLVRPQNARLATSTASMSSTPYSKISWTTRRHSPSSKLQWRETSHFLELPSQTSCRPGLPPDRPPGTETVPIFALPISSQISRRMGARRPFYPGTHRAESGPPDWFRTPDRIPKAIPGMVKVVVPAGTCMINDTNMWHTSTPNLSENPRKLIWTVFKTADRPLPSEDLRNSQWFVDRQTDPLRRKLCGTDV